MSKLFIKKLLHPQIYFGEDNLDGSFNSKFKLSREFDTYRIKPSTTKLSIDKDCSIYEFQLPPDVIKHITGCSNLLNKVKSNLNHLEFNPDNQIKNNSKILRTADYLIVHQVNDYSSHRDHFTLIDNMSGWRTLISSSEYELNYKFPLDKPSFGRFIELTSEEWGQITCYRNLKSELTKYSRLTIAVAELVSLIHPMVFYSLPIIK